jgi:hypothetical protein
MSATISKDSQVEAKQLEQKSLALTANLVAATSEAPALLSIDNSTIAATVLTIDLKQAVSKCHKVQVTNRASGQAEALAAAPSVSGSEISVTLDATGLSDVCVEVIYKA